MNRKSKIALFRYGVGLATCANFGNAYNRRNIGLQISTTTLQIVANWLLNDGSRKIKKCVFVDMGGAGDMCLQPHPKFFIFPY